MHFHAHDSTTAQIPAISSLLVSYHLSKLIILDTPEHTISRQILADKYSSSINLIIDSLCCCDPKNICKSYRWLDSL